MSRLTTSRHSHSRFINKKYSPIRSASQGEHGKREYSLLRAVAILLPCAGLPLLMATTGCDKPRKEGIQATVSTSQTSDEGNSQPAVSPPTAVTSAPPTVANAAETTQSTPKTTASQPGEKDKGLPIYPHASLVSDPVGGQSSGQNKGMAITLWKTQDPVDAVVAFYTEKLSHSLPADQKSNGKSMVPCDVKETTIAGERIVRITDAHTGVGLRTVEVRTGENGTFIQLISYQKAGAEQSGLPFPIVTTNQKKPEHQAPSKLPEPTFPQPSSLPTSDSSVPITNDTGAPGPTNTFDLPPH